jgi:hypothetical protein
MSEMKYLRDRVDTLPTGPFQGVSTGLQASQDYREPSSQSSSSVEAMEVIEQTDLPCFTQVPVPVQPLETSTSANHQVSEMAYFRALVRKHVSSEVCPLPPESPSLSQPKFVLFGAQAPPRLLAKALVALPPSLSIVDCSKLLCNTVRDSATGSVGHQCSWTLADLVLGQRLASCLHPTCRLLISSSRNITGLILRCFFWYIYVFIGKKINGITVLQAEH